MKNTSDNPFAKCDDDLMVHLKAVRTLLRDSSVLASEPRKKAIRTKFGHQELAELMGDLQQLSLAPIPAGVLDAALEDVREALGVGSQVITKVTVGSTRRVK